MSKRKMDKKLVIGLLAVAVIAVAFGYWWFFVRPYDKNVTILGAGASFPYPLIVKWSQVYGNATNGRVTINYQSVGSGAGITQITNRKVQFGASDAPMSATERNNATGILHIPETIGAVVIAYNIPGATGRLKLTGTMIADIYLGKINKWNDPSIILINPGLNLPDQQITVVKRSDSSGTTFVFTDYLSSASTDWKAAIGKGKVFNIAETVGSRGVQGKGNEGVTAIVKQNSYSIGYIELTYALQNGITYALIRNKAGVFIDANSTTVANAAASVVANLPSGDQDWSIVSMVNPDSQNAYPISSFTYLLVYKDLSYLNDPAQAKALVDFLKWMVTDGQQYSTPLSYVPLPQQVTQLDQNTISMMKW